MQTIYSCTVTLTWLHFKMCKYITFNLLCFTKPHDLRMLLIKTLKDNSYLYNEK